jgi:hypothetical protein
MRIKRGIAAVLAAAIVAIGLSVVDAAPALADSGCTNWSNTFSRGHAYGQACYTSSSYIYNWTVNGTVFDDKADGQCVYVKVYFDFAIGGEVVKRSPRICGNGKKLDFTITANGVNLFWAHNTIEYEAA